jgi:DNA-binding transcriptional LysR family regulator
VEMHQVRYFLAAARGLSFTRAAEACHVSQPALTTSMKKLEAEFGGQLFYREANRLALTEFGRRMVPLMGEIAERAEAAIAAAESMKVINQTAIRLGVMPTLGPLRLARFLADFERTHPGIDLALSEGRIGELGASLEADRLDVAILNPIESPGDSFRIEALYTERYVVILPPEHPLKESNGIKLTDVIGQPYVDRLACEMRGILLQVSARMGVQLDSRFRSEREDWVQAMVAAGLGFAFVPEYAVTHPGTIQRPLIEPLVERTVALMTKPGRPHPPAVDSFVRAARGYRWLA